MTTSILYYMYKQERLVLALVIWELYIAISSRRNIKLNNIKMTIFAMHYTIRVLSNDRIFRIFPQNCRTKSVRIGWNKREVRKMESDIDDTGKLTHYAN